MPVVPGRTACLRCLFEEPPADEVSTGATVGVLGAAPAVVGALEAAAAMRILVGSFEPPTRLTSVDVWTGECDSIVVERAPRCPVCGSLP
jgi:molybdopterin/thiamine biosynthesis adenylyltransferase